LSVRHGDAILNVDTGDLHRGRVADLKLARLETATDGVLRRAVVCKANAIKSVLAVAGLVLRGRVADFDAELVRTNELRPPLNLVGATIRVEDGTIEETADRIATTILSSRVELSSEISLLDVELGLVDHTSDHPVLFVLEDLHALDSTIRDLTSAMALLGTVGNYFALSISDKRVGFVRRPETEIIGTVKVGCLAHRRLAFGSRVTDVKASLRATLELRASGWVDLIRCVGRLGEAELVEGSGRPVEQAAGTLLPLSVAGSACVTRRRRSEGPPGMVAFERGGCAS